MLFDGERFWRRYLAVCLIVAPVGGWALLTLTAWVNGGSWLGIAYTAFCYLCAVAVGSGHLTPRRATLPTPSVAPGSVSRPMPRAGPRTCSRVLRPAPAPEGPVRRGHPARSCGETC